MRLWKLKVPLRVKLFLWHACRNCLQNRTQLQTKGVACSGVCAQCDPVLESNWHLFVVCPKSVSCWDRADLGVAVRVAAEGANSFKEWCFNLLCTLPSIKAEIFAVTLWSLWKARNVKIWEDTMNNAVTLCDDSVQHQWNISWPSTPSHTHSHPPLSCYHIKHQVKSFPQNPTQSPGLTNQEA